MNKTNIRAVCLAVALTLAGCTADDRPPFTLIAAVDVSSPDDGLLSAYGAGLFKAQRDIPARSIVTFYTFAGGSQEVYSGPHLVSRDRFNERIGGELLRSHQRQRTYGTRPEAALSQAVRAVEGTRDPTVLVVATDGGVEDQGATVQKSIAESASRLAELPHLCAVVVFGVLPQHRARWREWLAPLGDRASVRGLNDGEDALTAALDRAMEEQR